MNAQEAIRLFEKDLAKQKVELQFMIDDYVIQEQEKKEFEDFIKAQEIVLESAKVLHESHQADVYADNGLIYRSMSAEVFSEDFSALGIEEEDDE